MSVNIILNVQGKITMTERDRLIKLIDGFVFGTQIIINNLEWNSNTVKELADYLLASGMIVPPCKVGDVVYSYFHRWIEEDGIFPYQTTNITITQNKKGEWTKKYRAMRLIEGKTIDWQLNFSFDDLGKTVFLTREDAENALKRGVK